MSTISRHVGISNDEIGDLTGALAWAVNTVDTVLNGADMIRISVEQIMRLEPHTDDWRPVWVAAVSGVFETEVE